MNTSIRFQVAILITAGLLIALSGVWLFVYSPMGIARPMSVGYAAAVTLSFAGAAGAASLTFDVVVDLLLGKYPSGEIPVRKLVGVLATGMYLFAALVIAALQAAANAVFA